MTPRLLLRVGGIALGGSLLYEGAQSNAPLVVAGALLLLILAAAGRERSDALTSSVRRFQLPTRGVLLVVAALVLVAIGWLNGLLSPPLRSPTPYGNDAVVLDECAAQVLLGGRDPYGSLRFFHCYAARGIGPSHTTPLRAGAFADVTLYPSDAQQEAAWAADRRACLAKPSAATCEPAEFVWRLSYPALSVGLILPWVALGWDTNLLYLLCLIAAIALVLVRARAGARPALLVGILAAVSVPALALGGSVDLLYALPLVAAWLWRERRWSALALGISTAVKQLAWPFAALYLIQVGSRAGRREAALRAALVGGVFAAANAPFVMWDARSWLAGIITPVAAPMFPRGIGIVSLATTGLLPLLPGPAYLVMEGLAGLGVLVIAWRTRRSSPELGAVLALIPLFFAWRSLSSYFYLLPLFAAAAIARLPATEPSTERSRERPDAVRDAPAATSTLARDL